MTTLQDKVKNGSVGDTITDDGLGTVYSHPATTNDNENRTGGTLAYSDLPETVGASDVNKVLCYSPIPGSTNFRVYLHHVNGTGAQRSFRIVIRNPYASDVHVTVNYVGSGNRSNWLYAGKDAETNYLNDTTPGSPQTIAAGGQLTVVSWSVAINNAVSAIYDISTDGQIKVYVVCGTVPDYNNSANYVARDSRTHNRGTFAGMNVAKTLSSAFVLQADAAPVSIRAGAVTPSGTDYTISPSVPDIIPGSFGVLYEIGVPVTNPGTSTMGVGVVLNPRGGDYGGAVRDITASNAVISTPAGDNKLSLQTQGVIVSRDNVDAGQQKTKRFNFIPPGGSNMPVDFVVVPYVP